MDKHLLLKELQAKHNFPDEDFPRLIALFSHCTFKKNVMMFSAGQIVKHTFFILKGCVRQYYISPEGAERIIYFAKEGNWCGELNSFLHEEPTQLNMQALEDVEAIYLTRENWEKGMTTIPALIMYHVKNHQRLMVRLKEELGKALNETPDEKYRRLLKESPELLQRILF